MTKIPALFFCLFIIQFSKAQKPAEDHSAKKTDTGVLDADLMGLLNDSAETKTYTEISLGIGNKLFSVKNNTVNTSQIQVNKLYYTPALAYHHKSGFSISLMPYLASANGSLKVYQTAISPAYDYADKKIGTGISYTRYIANNNSFNSDALYQNDFYAYVKGKKGFIQPEISLGYSTGKFKEINIDTIHSMNPIIIRDSTKNSIKDFSLSAGIGHLFKIMDIFRTGDDIGITPQIMLTAGSEKYLSAHINKNIPAIVKRSKRIRQRSQTNNSPLALQSLAFSLNADYSIGKFSVNPNVYVDYYLPQTTSKRLSSVYSVTFAFSL